MPIYPPYNRFYAPVEFNASALFNRGLHAYMQADGTPAVRMTGAAVVGQIMVAEDSVLPLPNPIAVINTDGAGIAILGDRVSAFPPGDVFNVSFSTLTHAIDSVTANSAGVRLGHGTSQGAALFVGTGAPGAANPVTTGVPPNGSIYFRADGAALNQRIYHVEGGAWVPLAI